MNWITIATCISVGLICSFISFKMESFGFFCIGFLGGMFISLIILNTFNIGNENQVKYIFNTKLTLNNK